MADIVTTQGLFETTAIPLVLQPLDFAVDPSRGIMQPIRADGSGAILVRPVGPGLVLAETIDLTDITYTPVSGDVAPIVAGFVWGFDPDNAEYSRVNMTRETGEFAGSDLKGLNVTATKWVYIGSLGQWHEQQGNTSRSFFTSSARTATSVSSVRQNATSRAGHFIFEVTALAGTPSVVVTIETENPLTGNFYPIAISTAITTIGVTVFKIGPGYTPVPNITYSDNLPLSLRATVTHATADSITYSLNANLFP